MNKKGEGSTREKGSARLRLQAIRWGKQVIDCATHRGGKLRDVCEVWVRVWIWRGGDGVGKVAPPLRGEVRRAWAINCLVWQERQVRVRVIGEGDW